MRLGDGEEQAQAGARGEEEEQVARPTDLCSWGWMSSTQPRVITVKPARMTQTTEPYRAMTTPAAVLAGKRMMLTAMIPIPAVDGLC